jgi:hypothetical protein
MCAQIYFVELKHSQLKKNHLNKTPSTKAVGGGIYSGVFDKDVKVPVKVTRRSSLVPLLPTFILSWLLARSRMTQARFAGQGQNSGRVGYGSGNGQGQGCGRGTGYMSKAKMLKVGLCKELENNIFDYGVPNTADLMRTTQEKIGQYVGIKYGEDIANELTNKTAVTMPPPVYSTTILLRHQKWERHVRRKQLNMRTALDAKLAQLQSASGIQDAVAIAKVENQVKYVAYHQGQEVPYNLTDSEKLKYDNESKMHSQCIATLEKHCGDVYALIYGQCTQILQDKMKQDKNWVTVSVSYKPLELYKLIERVTLKQTEDQYPVAVLWEQFSNVANAKQGNSTNNKWHGPFNTKVEVAESVGVSFDFEKIWEYCALEAHKAAYTSLRPDKQEAARVSAWERFLLYALIKTSISKHDKIKDDLLDDYTKGSDNYPQTRLQALMLMDHYSKTPTAITTLEGTTFAQSGKKKKKVGDKEKKPEAAKNPKDFDKEWWKDKECYRCGKKGHPASACSVNCSAIMTITRFTCPGWPAMQWQQSRSP